MAKPMQSVDPTLLALQTANTVTQNAKKKVLPSLSTPAIAKPSLNVQTQQSQAISTPPTAKVGGISSPFGAPNINSSPVLGGATPNEIGTTAKQLQLLPKAMPKTGSDDNQKYIDLQIDIKKGMPFEKMKELYNDIPESAQSDLYNDLKRGMPLEKIPELYPELQGGGQDSGFVGVVNKFIGDKTPTQALLSPIVRFARGVADVGQGIQEGIDTGLTKIGLLPDQTEANKKARAFDEQMTQGLIGGKGQADTLLQEAGRIGGSMIANAPASKLGTIGKMALGATEGLLGGAAYNVSTGEGVGSPVNLGLSTAIGAAIPAVGPLLQGAKKLAKKVPVMFGQKAEGLAVQGLLNANDAKKIVRTLKETGEGDVGSLGRRALERGIAGKTTEQAIDVAKEIASKNYQGVRSAISEISDKVGTLAKDDTVAKAMTMVGKQADNINNRVGFNAIDITEIDNLGRKALNGELTLLDKQRSKELIDEFVNIFKKSGEVSDTQIADVAATLRNNIKNSIEDIVDYATKGKVNIREMNREVAVAKAFEQGIQNKATANELKQFAIQGIAGGVASNQGDFTTPEGIGKFFLGAFMGRQVGKLLGDPAVLGKIAKVVDKMSMGSRKGLLEFIKKPTQEIPEALLKEIIPMKEEIKNLALPLLNNVDTPILPMASATNNQTLLKGTNVALAPKPTPKTPPITVEKGAIGMGTPKATVLPPKPTVAPSVSAPKVDTFKRMTELDSNPLYRKLTGGEILGGGKIKQGLFETPLGTITNEIMDGKVKKYVVNGKPYNATDLGGIREKQAPEIVAQANIASKAISDLKAIEKGQGKVTGSSLRSVLDELGIDKVDNIPEGAEAEVLKMVRARSTPPAPKGFKGLGKETMEQNISKADDLVQEAKKYKSADEFINDHKKLFHTTSESNAQRIDAEGFIEGKSQGIGDRLVDGVFFVDNEMPLSTITRYSKEPSKIIEGFVSRGSKIKEFKTMDNFEDFLLKDKKYLDLENADLSSKRAKEIFIENGIDVVIKPYGKGTEYIVVNPKVLRTKSQLKQIREQANKKPLPPAPKGFKGLGKETMEQNISKADDSLIQEAKKYKSAEEFRNAHQSKSLLDLSDPKRQRWGRLLEDGVDEDTGKYMDLTYTTERYADQYKYYPDSKVPKVTNPNQEVTIYRGTTTKQGDMMPGDFVTFSKDYALSHNEGAKLLVKKVPAKDVVWQGNDFSEWIYSPESMRGKTYNGGLEKIREQANKKTLPPLPKKGK